MKMFVSVVAVLLLVAVAIGPAAPASTAVAATPASATFVGSRSVSPLGSGGEYIYVSTSGTDLLGSGKKRQYCLVTGARSTACPAPDARRPLRTIQTAIRVAEAGDVVVVRSGTYAEVLGYAANAGTSSRPIVLQSEPGARVTVTGSLQLKSAHFWRVVGMRFLYSSTLTTGQAVVSMVGGRNWVLSNNEIAGTRGVANLLIREDAVGSGATTAQRTAAAPQDYTVRGNCIRDQRGTAAHGLNHNIYLLPTIYSSGGLIERNLVVGATGGGNIKAAGSSDPNGSPRDVVIRYNTLLYSASGFITGLKAERIEVQSNVIGLQQNGDARDGAIKTYRASYPDRIGVKDNLIAGFAKTIIQPTGEKPVYAKRNAVTSSVALTGSVANCSVRLVDPGLASSYGVQYAG